MCSCRVPFGRSQCFIGSRVDLIALTRNMVTGQSSIRFVAVAATAEVVNDGVGLR